MIEHDFKVTCDEGARLDIFLVKTLPGNISRTKIQRLIRDKDVLLNGIPAKPNTVLKVNDAVSVRLRGIAECPLEAQNISLDIAYEDDAIIVVNKPAGMLVHPAGTQRLDTLVNALVFHARSLSEFSGTEKPGIVHRLDKDTSGLMVIAKTDYAHAKLAAQFKERSIYKEYIAFVKGIVNNDEGFIETPISRSRTNRKKMCVNFSSSRKAFTGYRVIERLRNATVLKILPKTGRTHQIRVHLSYIGHPILGDIRYGGSIALNRQALHAKTIGFEHPVSGKYMEFTSKIPEDMASFLKTLKICTD